MKNKKFKKAFSILLIIVILLISITIFKDYNVRAKENYVIKNNLIKDNSFENFNESARDCCNINSENSKVFAEKSNESTEGNFCLNLTSENRCACINKPVTEFNNQNIYFLTFQYKGDNPRFCSWFEGNEKCLPDKKLETTIEWTQQKEILFPTEKTNGILIFFYADSDGTKTVTNFYDDLQVRKLIEIDNNYNYNESEEYIIKTKADNNVNGERISEIEDGEAYFLIQGEPKVTIKFPLTELIIILIMLIIIIRLTKHEK
jgi:hypothetical protein